MDAIDNRASAPHSLFHKLHKPPMATSLTVRALLDRVGAGAVRVPTFQRPLRWRQSDVVTLFDSILKGYPIGSLLFWKQRFPEDAAIRVGDATLHGPAVEEGWFIVDGQQRVTALASALMGLDHRGNTLWDLRYDPATDCVLPDLPEGRDAERQAPLSALGDLRRLGRWFRECELTEGEQDRVEDAQKRILDYSVPAYVVDTDDVDALRGVFARMNSTGVRMKADEVFQALLGAPPDGEGRKSLDLDALQHAADIDNFGEPPRGEILKAVLAMSGLDATRRFDTLAQGELEHLVGLDDAVEALRRAASFLQSSGDAGASIPAYAFIPYPVVFVILAKFFHRFPEPDEASRRALSTWVWRGVASGVHQRAAVSALRLQVRAIGDDLSRSIAALAQAVGEPQEAEWKLDPFHSAHAQSRVEILTLLERRPRDLIGPVSWRALVSGGERAAREVFAVQSLSGEERDLARTGANRVLLDARQQNLRSELKRWSWEKDRVALESHLIDERSFGALLEGDANTFLKHRGARLRQEVAAFLAQRARLGEGTVLPSDAYFDLETSAP